MMSEILYVDDDLINLQLFELHFNKYFDISVCVDPVEAIELAIHRQFPLVVTDYRMPGINADTLIQRVKEHHPSCVFIILSGYFERDISYDRSSVFKYVSKPYEPKELLEVIQSALVATKQIAAH